MRGGVSAARAPGSSFVQTLISETHTPPWSVAARDSTAKGELWEISGLLFMSGLLFRNYSYSVPPFFRMLRLNVVLLAFLVSSLLSTGEAGRQRRGTSSKKERKNVAKLGPEGKNCAAGGKLVCHKDVKTKFSSTLAV